MSVIKVGRSAGRTRLCGVDWAPKTSNQRRPVTVYVVDEVAFLSSGYTISNTDINNLYRTLCKDHPRAHIGLQVAGHAAACGHCPRGLFCMRGVVPSVLCPRCRRTNHIQSGILMHGLEHVYLEAVHNKGDCIAEPEDYVPSACPLWLSRQEYLVDSRLCPICEKKAVTVAIHVQHVKPYKRRELLVRLKKQKRNPNKTNSIKAFLERRNVSKKKGLGRRLRVQSTQQTLRRPTRRARARGVQQR